ncbi:unnamed protein product, partial [Rotaria socialis]
FAFEISGGGGGWTNGGSLVGAEPSGGMRVSTCNAILEFNGAGGSSMFVDGTSIVGDEVVTIFVGTTFTNGGGITVFASVDG